MLRWILLWAILQEFMEEVEMVEMVEMQGDEMQMMATTEILGPVH